MKEKTVGIVCILLESRSPFNKTDSRRLFQVINCTFKGMEFMNGMFLKEMELRNESGLDLDLSRDQIRVQYDDEWRAGGDLRTAGYEELHISSSPL